MLNSTTEVNKSTLDNKKCFKNAIIIIKLKCQASIPDCIAEENGLLTLNYIL